MKPEIKSLEYQVQYFNGKDWGYVTSHETLTEAETSVAKLTIAYGFRFRWVRVKGA